MAKCPILVRAGRLAAVFALLSGAPLFALEQVTLQLKWTHQFQFAGYYTALPKWFWPTLAGSACLLVIASMTVLHLRRFLNDQDTGGRASDLFPLQGNPGR